MRPPAKRVLPALMILAGASVPAALPAAAAGADVPYRPSAPVGARAVAVAVARRTGKSVVVDALTTGSSTTTADPAGTFTVQSAVPVRKRVDGACGIWTRRCAVTRTVRWRRH
jgi:hypothetical protein